MDILNNKKLILFVEDPGAVNYFLPLIKKFKSIGVEFELLAQGTAIDIFKKNNIFFKVNSPLFSENIIKEYDLVIVGTSENIFSNGLKLINNAKKNYIKTIGIIDNVSNSEYRFKGDTSDKNRYAPDYLFVPDKYTLNIYLKMGYKKENLFIIGHPMYADNLIPKESKLELREKIFPKESFEKLIIVFVSELSTGLNPNLYLRNSNYTLHGRGNNNLRTNIVAEELIDSINRICHKEIERPFTVLRRHPKETASDLKEISKEFDFISQEEDPIEIIYASDLVIGMSTLLLNQAYLIGTESLAVLPEIIEETLLPQVRSGEIQIITKSKDLDDFIKSFICKNIITNYDDRNKLIQQYSRKKKLGSMRTEDIILKNLNFINSKNF